MRVLIQNPQSQKFLARHGHWDATATNAEDFKTPIKAIAFAKATSLHDFRLVLHFPERDGSAGLLVGAKSPGARAAHG